MKRDLWIYYGSRRRQSRLWYTLQCAAVCCSVLQCVAVCCSVLQCVAVRWNRRWQSPLWYTLSRSAALECHPMIWHTHTPTHTYTHTPTHTYTPLPYTHTYTCKHTYIHTHTLTHTKHTHTHQPIHTRSRIGMPSYCLVLPCVAMCYSVLQCVAGNLVCYSMLQYVDAADDSHHFDKRRPKKT